MARIIYAEDFAGLRESVSRLLKDNGHTVTDFDDAAKVMPLVVRNPENFDLVITDGDMPRMTGYELVTRIREANINIPVILLSGDIQKHQISGKGFFNAIIDKSAPDAIAQLLGNIELILEQQE